MTPTLESVLADWRERASAARRARAGAQAELIDEICADVARAAEDYLRFLSERDAQLRSAKGVRYLRSRFPEWEAQGNARRNAKGDREYRALIVPTRANIVAARERGRRGEHAA